jgi:hypothetical protein
LDIQDGECASVLERIGYPKKLARLSSRVKCAG